MVFDSDRIKDSKISKPTFPLDLIARLPHANDNVAIAVRRIESGSKIQFASGAVAEMEHTVLEGHRFATRSIAVGEPLLSWSLPFGVAISNIRQGTYVCNQSMLDALSVRNIEGAHLPIVPNFRDHLAPYNLDEINFRPGVKVGEVQQPRSFMGYRRVGQRGIGTRNFIVILGTTSRTASFARMLASRLQPAVDRDGSLDGVVAIAHTEGGGSTEPNNANEVLKALAGFMVHPNVAAVLAVDFGVEPINNRRLQRFLEEHSYPIEHVPHHFMSLTRGVSTGLQEGESIARHWFEAASSLKRTPQPLSGLKVALQCGGSDAFSGVSGNPLAGAMVHELIRHGGSGVLTETDEVVGAEAYVLQNVRDLATANRFLSVIEDFKAYLAWHGVSSESNPSGGNKFRGLYNIALKSVGAVHKKDPRTTLDYITHYADLLDKPGFYFMNGPGNDLEGIAGQVAAGCNLILFVTGNGSVTNFPFVPTLKITTTTRRHNLLIREMDINAGEYLDGVAFETMSIKAFETLVSAASGERTKGEIAGHSQVSIWRNWPQTDTSQLALLQAKPVPNGMPIEIPLQRDRQLAGESALRRSLPLYSTERGLATDRIGLVLPLSLCSSQVAKLAADRLNEMGLGERYGISQFIALPHTEACGSSGDSLFRLLHRSYQGYVMHPNVTAAFLLEHGCEKITNDAMRHDLKNSHIDAEQFGWASVQLDGGIEKATNKIEKWFEAKLEGTQKSDVVQGTLGRLTFGLMTTNMVSNSTVTWIKELIRSILFQGGSVIIPDTDFLLANESLCFNLFGELPNRSTIAYGERVSRPGLHLVDSETEHWVENLTCLGACGAHVILSVISEHARQSHPMIPVIQCAEATTKSQLVEGDIDFWLTSDLERDLSSIEEKLQAVIRGDTQTVAAKQAMVDFQFARGRLGVTS